MSKRPCLHDPSEKFLEEKGLPMCYMHGHEPIPKTFQNPSAESLWWLTALISCPSCFRTARWSIVPKHVRKFILGMGIPGSKTWYYYMYMVLKYNSDLENRIDSYLQTPLCYFKYEEAEREGTGGLMSFFIFLQYVGYPFHKLPLHTLVRLMRHALHEHPNDGVNDDAVQFIAEFLCGAKEGINGARCPVYQGYKFFFIVLTPEHHDAPEDYDAGNTLLNYSKEECTDLQIPLHKAYESLRKVVRNNHRVALFFLMAMERVKAPYCIRKYVLSSLRIDIPPFFMIESLLPPDYPL